MWRWIAVLLMVAVSAVKASAQTVEVRAGEHDDFTRLVFNLPERMDFEVSRKDAQVDLVFGRSGMRFDTSAVFQRVPTTRLTDIKSQPNRGAVSLSLACNCEIETFWFSNASLVVDISTSTEPEPAQSPPSRESQQKIALPTIPETSTQQSNATRLTESALSQQPDFAQPPLPDPTQEVAEQTLKESRERLLQELGRAATQGLLSPNRDFSAATDDSQVSEAAPLPEPEPETPPNPGSNIHLRAENSIDRDMRDILMPGLVERATDSCLDARRVDVASWGKDAPYSQQVSPLRSGLVGEFDAPDKAGVTELIKLYLYFGFGAEAAQLLKQFPGAGKDADLLSELARIIEYGHAGPNSMLVGQMECEPMTALWSTLSYPSLPNNVLLDGDAVLRGFSSLPPHLRSHLGPSLARKFENAGFRRESARIRRVLDRSEETGSPEADLLSAEVALSEGRVEVAEEQLGSLVEDNSEPSAEALLALIDARIQRDAEVSYELAQLAGAYSTEYRGDSMGHKLAQAYLLALAASGAFDQAFDELSALKEDLQEKWPETLSGVTSLLARKAPDYEFLHHAIANVRYADQLSPETANATAARLLDLGFVGAAEALAANNATGSAEYGRKLIRAEIALLRDRPRQAEAELLGVQSEDAELMRARARSSAGEHDAAHDIYNRIGMRQEAERQAWLDLDWDLLSDATRPEVSSVAQLKLGGAEDDREMNQGILARDRELIEASATMRAAMTALLAAHPAPEMQP